MSKLDQVKKMLSKYYDEDTGESIDVEKIVDMVIQCDKDDKKKKQRDGLKIVKPANKKTFKKRRDFKMVFEDDSIKRGLTAIERGIYDLLCTGVDKSGSCLATIIDEDILIDSNRKLFSYLKIGYPKGKKALDTLIERNLIQVRKFGNRTLYYVNPRYHRYGNQIDLDIKKLFNIPSDEFE